MTTFAVLGLAGCVIVQACLISALNRRLGILEADRMLTRSGEDCLTEMVSDLQAEHSALAIQVGAHAIQIGDVVRRVGPEVFGDFSAN